MVNEHDLSLRFPQSANLPSTIVCNEGKSKESSLFFQILSIIVDTDPENEELPNVMDRRFGRSNHSNV